MKKYLVFILSFLVLHAGFQVVTGMFLTMAYTPDPASAFSAASQAAPVRQEVSFGEASFLPLPAALLSATIAYILSQKMVRTGK